MIVIYDESYKKAWDRFVMTESCNGTFLQTRNFLDYHPEGRFKDSSLMFMKGNNIVAVIPANIVLEDGRKIIYSHLGSTFGGIILGKSYKKISDIEEIFDDLMFFLQKEEIAYISLKMTSNLYSNQKMDILDYYLQNRGFTSTLELGYFVELESMNVEEIEISFNSSRRRGLRKSLKCEMLFKKIEADEEIEVFYKILCNNMEKFSTTPIHSLEELLEFKNARLDNIVSFYGVYRQEDMVAGSMVFDFGSGKLFHTQYLATDQSKLDLYPSEFLYYSLIRTAKMQGYKYLSFGTSTLEHGSTLNKSLAQFKEGFGTETYVNRTYHKRFD